MNKPLLSEVNIRTSLLPGDVGYITYLHGDLYSKENGYGIPFEIYVAQGLVEFCKQYDPSTNRVWVAEHNDKRVGFLLLMNRGNAAQLRYFILLPEYRGIGLGKRMMNLYMDFLRSSGYRASYLWTTHEQTTAIELYCRQGFKLTEKIESTAFGKPLIEQRYDLVF